MHWCSPSLRHWPNGLEQPVSDHTGAVRPVDLAGHTVIAVQRHVHLAPLHIGTIHPILAVNALYSSSGLPCMTKQRKITKFIFSQYHQIVNVIYFFRTKTMCPVLISILVSAGSSLHDDVLERDDGGRSFCVEVMITRSAGALPLDLVVIRARHRSW